MREIFAYSLPLIILAAMAFGIFYVSKRISWAFSLNFTGTLIILATVSLMSLVAIMMIMRGNYTSGLSHIISNVANITAGVLMFLACIIIVADLVGLFIKIKPLSFGLIVIGLTALTTVYSLWNAQHHKIIEREITLPNMRRPMRIAHISDVHLGHYWGERTLNRIVEKILEQNVEAVFITGDLFDGRVRLNPEVLVPLKSILVPVYFVEGNHDGYSGVSEIKSLLKDSGITVLSNQVVELNGLQIVGLDYLMPDNNTKDVFHGSTSKYTMENVLPRLGINRSLPAVLLHHNPVGVNYAADNGINLYLAGHTHAGQLFPATIFASMMFEYNKGLYDYSENTKVYVSQGTGTFGPPMRLLTDSEITILNLK